MNDTRTLAHLVSLTEKQFADLFYEAVLHRRIATPNNEGEFVLAMVLREPDQTQDTVLIAQPDHQMYPDGFVDDAPLCQSGDCVECNSSVMSVAKQAICPACGAKVYCT